MTRRERRYLFIILALQQKISFIIRDTNETIALLEAQANLRLEALLKKQVEADSQVLKVWEENAETIWQEKLELEQKIKSSKQKRKERMRYEKGDLEI